MNCFLLNDGIFTEKSHGKKICIQVEKQHNLSLAEWLRQDSDMLSANVRATPGGYAPV